MSQSFWKIEEVWAGEEHTTLQITRTCKTLFSYCYNLVFFNKCKPYSWKEICYKKVIKFWVNNETFHRRKRVASKFLTTS